ncbi:hypothetical protein [Streptomyces viridochromogenes]|uniref:hypothetical protein n=1 Tax=Streptomyces viridochromogenes TaxID=1938 RepID=UPI00069E94F4|nr:hypothetical protein [Streptomyces viridochromogenes]KOG15913.1 hypothetical protein ADK36_28400 [Streptomyces viridochromogenes]KOG16702.1 hypothetical protein ADK35_26200 [Streptomyces viridochromogenes]
MEVKDIAEVTLHLWVARIEVQHDLLGAVGWLPRLLNGALRLGPVPQLVKTAGDRIQSLLL